MSRKLLKDKYQMTQGNEDFAEPLTSQELQFKRPSAIVVNKNYRGHNRVSEWVNGQTNLTHISLLSEFRLQYLTVRKLHSQFFDLNFLTTGGANTSWFRWNQSIFTRKTSRQPRNLISNCAAFSVSTFEVFCVQSNCTVKKGMSFLPVHT